MCDASIDGVRINIVRPHYLEAAVRIRTNRAAHLTQSAPDVDVRRSIARNQARIFTAPCSGYVGDRRSGSGVARDDQSERQDNGNPRHTLRVSSGIRAVNESEGDPLQKTFPSLIRSNPYDRFSTLLS